jgi:hypothetical protein
MKRRDVILGSLALLALPGIRAKAEGELDHYLGVREGEEKTKAAALDRLAEHYDADSVIIRRLQGTPERRIFFVDLQNMPRDRAERHIREVMALHRNGMPFAQANVLPATARA